MQLSMHLDLFRSGGGREEEITARHTAYEWQCKKGLRISSVRKVSGLLVSASLQFAAL